MDEPVDDAGVRRAAARQASRNLLTQNAVQMTVFAQDPSVTDGKPLLAQVEVPAGRLQRGPRSHRFHVVDIGVGTNAVGEPVKLHARSPWNYTDRWTNLNLTTPDLVDDRKFRSQNVFAVASYTLALFEQHLGRPIPWYSGYPHLYLIPQARIEANAFYSREHNAVLFGWLPSIGGRPPIYTTLSYDVISHEVSHAILDGLRPRYTEPGLPDQLAFHEALADLVALLSVFTLEGVAERLLAPTEKRVFFPSDAAALAIEDEAERRKRLWQGRAETLKLTPLLSLAEEIGARRAARHSAEGTMAGRYPALRRSVELPPNKKWMDDPQFQEAHRRAEVLVAAFLQTLVRMWAERLEPLRSDSSGMDVDRVAEEGVTSARHLLGMILRTLDYLPPVELEFADVIDAVLTADHRLAPDDQHNYRDALSESFAAFGITPPEHRIVDEDGTSAPPPKHSLRQTDQPDEAPPAGLSPIEKEFARDADASELGTIRYEHLNLVALRSSPEEVYQFIWNNSAALEIDVRLTTRVTRVLSSSRMGADGTLVTEVLADYVQTLRTTAANLPPAISKPDDMPDDAEVELLGGGVLVFDQFGRFRLHQRKPILEVQRQTRRLAYLFTHGIRDTKGRYGTSDGAGDTRRFSLLHSDTSEDSW
ncbi:hypothetical protein ACWDTI_24175 [Gordonia sp. NPDC003424]